jgi:hypothetical protein
VIDPKKPDWDSFETYKGPLEEAKVPKCLATPFHWLMISVLFFLVSMLGGIIGFVMPYLIFGSGGGTYFIRRAIAELETEATAWFRVAAGVVFSAAWLYRALYCRKRNDLGE